MTADVTGDGRADQVLLLGCSSVGSAYATEVQVFADGPILLARLAAPPLVPSAYFHPQFTRVGGRRAAAHHRRVLGPHRLPLLRLHPPVDHVAVDWAWICGRPLGPALSWAVVRFGQLPS